MLRLTLVLACSPNLGLWRVLASRMWLSCLSCLVSQQTTIESTERAGEFAVVWVCRLCQRNQAAPAHNCMVSCHGFVWPSIFNMNNARRNYEQTDLE